jgi:hypothetical protein
MPIDSKRYLMDKARSLKIFEGKLTEEIDFNDFDESAQAVIFSKESYLLGYMDAKKIHLGYFGTFIKLINKTINELPLELRERGNEVEYYKFVKNIINNIEGTLVH